MNNITLFKVAKDVKRQRDITINDFLDGVKNGQWWEQIAEVRAAKGKAELDAAKLKLSAVTLGATFAIRNMSKVETLSGFIGIDLDGIEDVEAVKNMLRDDTYIYSMFLSASKTGLCLIFEIDLVTINKFETRNDGFHSAYVAISDYLYKKYVLLTDPKCKDVTRLRFVSHDPELYLNDKARKFTGFSVPKKAKYLKPVVYVKTDLDDVIGQLCNMGVSLCEDYADWLKTGWALASTLGENGRDAFHRLSSVSSKYDYNETEKKWNNLYKTHNSEKVSIKYIYHKAKEAGINPYSEKTQEIIRVAANAKKDKTRGKETVAAMLIDVNPEMFKNESVESLNDIINQVYSQNIEAETENTTLDIVNVIQGYKLRYNEITNNLERDGNVIDDRGLNSLYINCKIGIPKTSKDLFCDILFSDRVKQYSPLKEFFATTDKEDGTDAIEALIKTINTDTEHYGLWITKWLVAGVASVYGETSPLVLVLCGGQNSGKTQWFRRILPDKLKPYYAESKMDAGKDDEILMTKKLIIIDDEYGGKNKKESKDFKLVTSKDIITVRLPYGRLSRDLKRLCMLGGTSNPLDILNDLTGNRRILPIHVLSIDHAGYNTIDKTRLWMQLYNQYITGYNYEMTPAEIVALNKSTQMFEAILNEEEAISSNFKPTDRDNPSAIWYTATEMIDYLGEKSSIRYNLTSLGLVLKKLGFEKIQRRIPGTEIRRWAYPLIFINKSEFRGMDDEFNF